MTNLSFNRKKIFGLEEDRVISFIQIKRSFFIFVIYFKFLKNVFERTDSSSKWIANRRAKKRGEESVRYHGGHIVLL